LPPHQFQSSLHSPPLATACTAANRTAYVPQEYYEFLEQDSADIFIRLGTFAWLAMAIAFVETLVCIKFGRG
jgi:hypothetical protein